jgi:hypothetical protein
MATTPTIVVGRNNWGIKNGNLLGYYQSADGFFVKREFAATRGGGTNGTFVGSNGFIQTATSGNLPRIDFTGGSPTLLVEPAATNLALQSQTFDVSGTWGPVTGGTGSLPSVTANAVISPDGTQNAETVLLNRGANNTSTDQSTLQQALTLATSGTYVFSVYAKATTSGDVGKQVFLRVGSGGGLVAYTLTANWVQLVRTETALASGSNILQIGNRGAFTNDNVVSVDLWGAQVETGSVATSYIPTTTGSVTRNADVISLTGATDYIGQTEGTIYAEVDMQKTGVINAIFALDVGSSSEYIALIRTSSNQFRASIKKSSGTQQNIINSSSYPIGIYKVAFAYKNGDYALYVNGVQAGTSTNATDFPTGSLTQAVVSNTNYGPFNDRIITAALYNERLSNQELIEITS